MAKKDLTPGELLRLGSALGAKRYNPLTLEGQPEDTVVFILDLNLAYEPEIVSLLEILQEKEWIFGYTVLMKNNISGEKFVMGFSDVDSIQKADSALGLLRSTLAVGFHWNDFPNWTKQKNGQPIHTFSGIQIPGNGRQLVVKKREPLKPPFPVQEE